MKAPDKIYLGVEDLDSEYTYALSFEDNGHPAYIRKDALLEWADAYKEEAEATCHNHTDNSSYGQIVAIRDLIDKLNSM